MTAPALAASRFGLALAVGGGLGLCYGFLRPLGTRLPHLRDLLFVLCAFWAWIYLSFGLCQGDIRVGYTAGLALGAWLWELTIGKWLRPVFSKFWKFLSLFLWPLKKIYAFSLFLLKKQGFLIILS